MLFIWNCFIFLRIFPFNPLPWQIPCLTILYLKVCLKQKIKKSLHRPISKAHSTWTEYYIISTTRSEVACNNQICWYNHDTMCQCPHWVGHKKCNFHLCFYFLLKYSWFTSFPSFKISWSYILICFSFFSIYFY